MSAAGGAPVFEFRDQVLRFLGDTFAFLMIVSALFDYRQILCLVTPWQFEFVSPVGACGVGLG